MPAPRDIVITGMGVVSPLGIGRDAFWQSLISGTSGVGHISTFDASALPVRLAAEVRGFDPQAYVKPRKSLKVMARDTQLGMTAAALAREDASLESTTVDPERFGVVFSADTLNPPTEDSALPYFGCMVDGHFDFSLWGTRGIERQYPLFMLKLLPNMIACHISIAYDARGHNNTLYTGDVSSLLAVGEAARVIARGHADVMLAGGASSRMQPLDWIRACLQFELSHREDEPAAAMRPFDLGRDGQVCGEGAATLVLEERRHATARQAPILAQLIGWSSACDVSSGGQRQPGTGLARAIEVALRQAGVAPHEVGHVNAHGLSSPREDRIEAQVLARLLPGVPVTAPKSFFGNLFSASGAVELAASVLALVHGEVPATLNYEQPDPECPLTIVRGEPLRSAKPIALVVNRTCAGQAAAVVVKAES
jgi:3-oxoacyl-[acyl-carrier-protein] synthase II